MHLKTITGYYQNQHTDCMMMGLFEDTQELPNIPHPHASLSILLETNTIDLSLGKATLLLGPPHIIVVGLGKKETFNELAYLTAIEQAARKIPKTAQHLICTLTALDVKTLHWRLRHATLKICYQLYQFNTLKSYTQTKAYQLKEIEFCGADPSEPSKTALQTGSAISKGIDLARELSNLPANICTPTYLATQAKQLRRRYPNLSIDIFEEKNLRKMKMDAFLSVSQGSSEPAKLILMHHKNALDPKAAPYVFIGKGITFDAGGLSLKSSVGMEEMKFDMCGAASIFGIMAAVSELNLPCNIIGVVAASENLPGTHATKPGDIVTTRSGKTVEIINTDAEGRLILCDTLSYVETFKPCAVIDIATLTGGMAMVLGDVAAGIMSNDDVLLDRLMNASDQSDDKFWPFPLWEAYQKKFSSSFADLPNVPQSPKAKGILAGCFLSQFASAYPWAHIDITGVAWRTGLEKGATGRPICAIMEYLLKAC